MELHLVRHAEPWRVDAGEARGPADPGLTERGRDQATRLAAWLAAERIDTIVTSPLRRAIETAAPLAARLDIDPVVDPGVTEYDAHSDEYIPIEEQRAANDDRWRASVEGRWEDGVDPEDFRERVVTSIDAIVARFAGYRVAVIAHGGVINVYTAHVLGLPNRLWFHPAYTSVSRVLAARNGLRTVATLNETAHLFATHDLAVPGGAQ
jgi:2,3-bisphosphoglycerate-dependent phosphoglycerate mutase